MQLDILSALSESVPRYTSYPTVPQFQTCVGPAAVSDWLSRVGEGEEISLYLHIPFCDRLCWFCACHTKHAQRYEPVASYLQILFAEIAIISQLIGKRVHVRAVHFGGGSPTVLRPADILSLDRRLRGAFDYAADLKASIEIDPNDMDEPRFDAWAAIGITRASIGVQDFEPKVQKAINREQSYEQTNAVARQIRARGVKSINLDLLYGLPHQTRESIGATANKAISLKPDRIALYGYAHVPWLKKHQNMIQEAWLPSVEERLAQSLLARKIFEDAGYEPVGMDHFAQSWDTLAIASRTGRLHRNFQGYTDDACNVLIGLEASSISRFQQGYAQSAPSVGVYNRLVEQGGPATVRGIEFTVEDRLRGWVIERLMCDFSFSAEQALELFGTAAEQVLSEASSYVTEGPEALFTKRDDLFMVTERGRPLVRLIAAKFDRYLASKQARFSKAI